MTTSVLQQPSTMTAMLRRLYLVRFAFAVVWAALLFLTASATGPFLTILLVVYPLADAAAVLWQLRSKDQAASRAAERINVAVSVAVAVALGWASTVSVSAALTVWGVWAAAAGLAQLATAVARRSSGGQVPQILSGALSVLAGLAFTAQGIQGASSISGVGGYAILGGVFFLISALRLGALQRRAS
ncbi:hypothetical protein [Cellulomonas fengjieae]|uniref:hypothetical protein n=1 Tax=Cellulomonas fengjieae TaxID=2819978 RepID=UPI001AAEFCCC|nr:hypothetical protein [Cellulomonas fengjieae]MBO3100605.1 hypothetical protein [Cellulomonas fengjieae]